MTAVSSVPLTKPKFDASLVIAAVEAAKSPAHKALTPIFAPPLQLPLRSVDPDDVYNYETMQAEQGGEAVVLSDVETMGLNFQWNDDLIQLKVPVRARFSFRWRAH